MPIVYHEEIETEKFDGGATYKTIVGDASGSLPILCGIQTSPPGYCTPNHTHPYSEVITVLEGTGEAWIGNEKQKLFAGITLIIPENTLHGFRATGKTSLITYGIHASPKRIVTIEN